MTPEQRKLARHALGLPNGANRSYRNSFTCGIAGKESKVLAAMVSVGLASLCGPQSAHSSYHTFSLTRAGALLALDEGESLNPEDFPEGGE